MGLTVNTWDYVRTMIEINKNICIYIYIHIYRIVYWIYDVYFGECNGDYIIEMNYLRKFPIFVG